MPRLRFRLRTLMILVAVVALALFVVQTRRRWQEFRQQAEVLAMYEDVHFKMAAATDQRTTAYRAQVAYLIGRGDVTAPALNVAAQLRQSEDLAKTSEIEAMQLRQHAVEYARLKRYFRSRWW
jgi:hypothetical protein